MCLSFTEFIPRLIFEKEKKLKIYSEYDIFSDLLKLSIAHDQCYYLGWANNHFANAL